LSGFYGLLRPLDQIRPHRLPMATPFPNPQGKSLYQYWGTRIAEAVDRAARAANAKAIVCLASVEYFKAVPLEALSVPVITPEFKEIRTDGIKTISFFAKRARGAMARYLVENRLTDPEALKAFDIDGYRFQPGASEGSTWVFARSEQPSTAKTKPAAPRIRKHAVDA
jgi:hypothetical protein